MLLFEIKCFISVFFLQMLNVQLSLFDRSFQLLFEGVDLLLKSLYFTVIGHLLLEDIALSRSQLLPQLIALFLQVIHVLLQLLYI